MAIDFFEREEHARRQTRRLLVMFALAVAVIILAIYMVLAPVAGELARTAQPRRLPGRFPGAFWDPLLFLYIAAGTLLVISVASLHKISEFAGGGETVALMLGGRPVAPQSSDPAERRLLNIVEEMALASGIPVPPVYVLDHEPGINAFAAGHRPADAVVAVSRGALQYLNREELQGVVGHEFSHILNGDMRLNLRLVGVVFGILVLSVIGGYLMRSVQYMGGSRGRGAGVAVAVFFLGGALCILGGLGVLLGKLIKSAICRQREFLADASAVQFTRNPGGLAGALKKIGGLAEGSRIRDGHAEEISHMFFGDAFAGAFFNPFATHPPLAERIRALEPDFDGRFPEVRPGTELKDEGLGIKDEGSRPLAASQRGASAAASAAVMPLGAEGLPPAPSALRSPATPAPREARSRGFSAALPRTEHLLHAARVTGGIPQTLLDSAREPYAARAAIYALLLGRDDQATRARQEQILQAQLDPHLCLQTRALAAAAQSLDAAARLPLVDLAVPALKRSSPRQYAEFRQVVDALMRAEGKVELFEYCLHMMLLGYLDVFFRLRKPPAIRYRTAAAVAQPAAVVLSTVAYVGAKGPEDAPRAFQAGAAGLLGQAAILPKPQCGLRAFDAALTELAQASPPLKRAVIQAVAAVVAADGQVTPQEGELVRAIAAALACPLPPGV